MKRLVLILIAYCVWLTPVVADIYRVHSAVNGAVGVQITFNGNTKEIQNILVFNKGKPPAVKPTFSVKTKLGVVVASGMIDNGNQVFTLPAGMYFMLPDVEKPYLYVSPFIIELNVPFGQ